MMRRLKNLTIRRKLTVVTMLATTAALLVASSALSTFDYLSFRRALTSNLQTHADIVGNNCVSDLSFGDAKQATTDLLSLRADPHVVMAALYDPSGTILATYFRDGGLPVPALSQLQTGDAQIFADRVEVARTISLHNATVGAIYIRSDVTQIHARIRNYALVLLGVFACSSAIALVLLAKLQGYISQPILHLTETAKRLTADKNYAVRAAKQSNDELGQLIDCFNEMLAQIQARDAQLLSSRDHLEEQVLVRTEELRTLNTTLAAAKEKAEAASRAKTSFLANMSHEIRTPMTAILGYADVMLEPDRTQSDRQDCLQVIRRNARHLLELINDILDISKIEAEKMTLDRLPADLPQLMSEVCSLLRPRAIEKDLDFHVFFDGAIPRQIRTDALRIKQILLNLLANSIKFSTKGSITLKISCQPCTGDSVLRFEVSDTGIGMTEAQIGRLFQPFSQADESMTRKYGGTGLGLAISKRLAVLLGGDITVHSTPGVGSTFTVTISGGPLEGVDMLEGLTESIFAAHQQPTQEKKVRLSGRILLAEDGEDNQALISMHLRRAGAEVVIAENGRIAVTLARAQTFDIILMDMQMPELDGYGATSELRSRGHTLPIIALTAHAMVGDRERCIQAGCTDYTTKPIDKQQLLVLVRKYIEQSKGVALAAENAAAASRPALAPPPGAKHAAVLPDARPSGDRLKSTFAERSEMSNAVAGFVSRLPDRVGALAIKVEAGDLDAVQRLVHQIKSSAAGYGFPDITALAARTEEQLKAEAEIAHAARAINELVSLIRSVDGYESGREAYHAAKIARSA